MGLFDKVKNLFLEEEEGGEKLQQPQQQAIEYQAPGDQPLPEQVINVQPTPQPQAPADGQAAPNVEGRVNPELLMKLEAALKEFNLPGPDYLELKAIMDNANFRQNIPDERQRIMSAFFSIQAGNPSFSKAIVINSINEYVSRLQKEREAGLQQLGQRVEADITAPLKSIDDKREKIAQLQAEIDKLQNEILEVEQQVEQRRTELMTRKMDFDKTFDAIIGALQADMAKIDSVIQ